MGYEHIRTFLRLVSTKWPSKGGILLAEFGFGTFEESSMTLPQSQADLNKSIWFLSMLNEILEAIHLDGIKMIGVIGWAFVDNWEWGEYDDRYGVQAFNQTTLVRSYKRSIFDFVDFFRAHQVV